MTPLEEIDLQPGERRGYWKHYAPRKWYKQAKIHGKLNNRRAVILLDTGAEVSILDTTFARELGCLIDTEVTQECVGIRDETYYTVGRTKIKITLAGNLYPVNLTSMVKIDPGRTWDVSLRPDRKALRLWVTRDKDWVTTFVKSKIGRRTYLRVTNVGDKTVTLDAHKTLGWWTAADALPQAYGFVQVGSRRYHVWQNLAYGATCEADAAWAPDELDEPEQPLTDRPSYGVPKARLRPRRQKENDHTARQRPVALAAAIAVAAPPDVVLSAANPDAARVKPETAITSDLDRSRLPSPAPEMKPGEDDEDDAVLIHEGSDLFAEDLESEMAVLPDLSLTPEVKIEDLKVGRPTGVEPEEASRQERRLRENIWKRRRPPERTNDPSVEVAVGVPYCRDREEERGRHKTLHRLSTCQRADATDATSDATGE
ncbi:unnamed protein product [Phytophthora fragariaefolia]|uniref:Unnamed protein product n=1 Tax=Phytophthora fragariaefolia TaxID=1490495 RepID=A0A9W6YHH1_9STRA|nr:unnamed protein product [Phytophthora fragariaefolia]